jgi:dCTP diphosphatase
MEDKLKALREEIVAFRDARDWKQFHTPKNLAAAIAIEAAELQEHFLWCSGEESDALVHNPDKRQAIIEELADVLNFSLLLADRMGIDVVKESRKKIQINAQKYPVEKARGTSKKYAEL